MRAVKYLRNTDLMKPVNEADEGCVELTLK